MHALLKTVEEKHLRRKPLGRFEVGDTVTVFVRIKEGDKEREQPYTGTVISKCRGHGKVNATFTVRRIVDGIGVERIFPVHSPTVMRCVVKRRGRVRRAKLFYLRDRVGKATKTKELVQTRHDRELALQEEAGEPAVDSANPS